MLVGTDNFGGCQGMYMRRVSVECKMNKVLAVNRRVKGKARIQLTLQILMNVMKSQTLVKKEIPAKIRTELTLASVNPVF